MTNKLDPEDLNQKQRLSLGVDSNNQNNSLAFFKRYDNPLYIQSRRVAFGLMMSRAS